MSGTIVETNDVRTDLTQDGDIVTETWSARMPEGLVLFGTPTDERLDGPVSDVQTETTATLAFHPDGLPVFFADECSLRGPGVIDRGEYPHRHVDHGTPVQPPGRRRERGPHGAGLIPECATSAIHARRDGTPPTGRRSRRTTR